MDAPRTTTQQRGRRSPYLGSVLTVLAALVLAAVPTGDAKAAPGPSGRVGQAPAMAAVPRADVAPGATGAGLVPNDLAAVSCTGPDWCVAVGSYAQNLNVEQTLVEAWDGTAWSIVPSPSPGSADELTGVSCTSPTWCVAVGTTQNETSQERTLVETWGGAAWSVVASPDGSATSMDDLTSVSCFDASHCMAVGGSTMESSTTTLALWDDGGTWSVVPPANPGSGLDELDAVACVSASSCFAVGDQAGSAANPQTLVERWDGSSWSVLASPNPGSSYDLLFGLSCRSASACTAVGTYGVVFAPTQAPVGQALVESWNGTTWVVVPSPDMGGATENELQGVSCSAPTACLAVGAYTNPTLSSTFVVDSPLVESWDGTTWSTVTPPLVGVYNNDLLGVSCRAAGACTAVGQYAANAANYDQTLVEAWDGTALTVVPSPDVSTLAAAVVGMASTPGGDGYWLVDALGDVSAHGAARLYGATSAITLNAPVVGMAATADGRGYWLVAADGGVFAFGDAAFAGSMGATGLNAPVVGMAASPDGRGYWLVAADGGVFAFGDATFAGSMGGRRLNQPVVGMAADTTTGGYWLAAADGGVFAFHAPFRGSMAGQPLNAPVVGVDGDPVAGGYWLVGADGGVFALGVAFHGSMGGQLLNRPVVGISTDTTTAGYWLVAADGGVFAFDAPFLGAD